MSTGIEHLLEFLPDRALDSLDSLPALHVSPLKGLCSISHQLPSIYDKQPTERITSPRSNPSLLRFTDEVNYFELQGGACISTYPLLMPENVRMAEPIADYGCIKSYMNRKIFCIADGCGWGFRIRQAAKKATEVFVDYLSRHQTQIRNVKEAGNLILNAVLHAHASISSNPEESALTTLLGGFCFEQSSPPAKLQKMKSKNSLLHGSSRSPLSHSVDHTSSSHHHNSTTSSPISSSSSFSSSSTPSSPSLSSSSSSSPASSSSLSENKKKWVVVFVNIGDCKLFLYSSRDKRIRDLTPRNRGSITKVADTGGTLGRHLDKTVPDFGNMSLFSDSCEEDDFIFFCSDGVHDNFDPQQLGFSPAELKVLSNHYATSSFPSSTSFSFDLFRSMNNPSTLPSLSSLSTVESSSSSHSPQHRSNDDSKDWVEDKTLAELKEKFSEFLIQNVLENENFLDELEAELDRQVQNSNNNDKQPQPQQYHLNRSTSHDASSSITSSSSLSSSSFSPAFSSALSFSPPSSSGMKASYSTITGPPSSSSSTSFSSSSQSINNISSSSSNSSKWMAQRVSTLPVLKTHYDMTSSPLSSRDGIKGPLGPFNSTPTLIRSVTPHESFHKDRERERDEEVTNNNNNNNSSPSLRKFPTFGEHKAKVIGRSNIESHILHSPMATTRSSISSAVTFTEPPAPSSPPLSLSPPISPPTTPRSSSPPPSDAEGGDGLQMSNSFIWKSSSKNKNVLSRRNVSTCNALSRSRSFDATQMKPLTDQLAQQEAANYRQLTVSEIIRRLLNYVSQVTYNNRRFMEQNPTQKQPSNMKMYKGKLDHATLLCFVVCPISLPEMDQVPPAEDNYKDVINLLHNRKKANGLTSSVITKLKLKPWSS